MERRDALATWLWACGLLVVGACAGDDGGRAVNDPNGATETNVQSAGCDAGTGCPPGMDCVSLFDGGPRFCNTPDAGAP